MTTENALPIEPTGSPAGEQHQADATQVDQQEVNEDGTPKAKPEKTAEQRELDRVRRGIDRKTRQLAEARAELAQYRNQPNQRSVTNESGGATNTQSQTDDEPLTLSRAELQKAIRAEAEKLAPTLQTQRAEIEHRRGVVQGLAKEWGQEKFDAYASDLDDALGGLADDKGRPKPITDAIFESDSPAALIEYLADPDNAEEVEKLTGMSAIQAGRAIAKLEAKLSTKTDKPQRSNAPTPPESLKAAGKTNTTMPDPSNTRAWMKWANENERRR